VNVIVGKLVN